jgi:NifU-like protein involved in Fe-S cluster formation
MNDRLDRFIDNLQQEIFDDAREVLGDAGFDRWQNPKYQGRMEDADASARVTGSCGDTMEIYLKFDGDRVADASYVTNGCGASAVCGSFAAEMAIGLNPDEIAGIDGETILVKLGQVPEEEKHCAFLAAETLQTALHSHMTRIL